MSALLEQVVEEERARQRNSKSGRTIDASQRIGKIKTLANGHRVAKYRRIDGSEFTVTTSVVSSWITEIKPRRDQ